jgi:signal transduction histidine kinase
MDVDQVIHGSIVYGVSAGLLVTPYFLGLAILHQKIVVPSGGDSWFRPDLLILLGAALIFNPLKNSVQTGLDRALFPERLGLPILLMDGSTKLSRASNLEEISQFLIKELPERISVDKAALFLRYQFGKGWELRESHAGWMDMEKEMMLNLDLLSKRPLPPFWDTLHDGEPPSNSGPLSFLKARGVTVLFPLKSGDDLWGFYLLGDKIMNRLLSTDEIRVIGTLSVQTAHTLGNARLMEGLQRTNRSLADLSHRLMQAERMADLGEGAAILAHEIKNPLGIVRGSAEILLKTKDASEREKVTSFILEETDRLSKTVDEFLQFARMAPPSKSDTDLNNLVQSAAFLWESRRKSAVSVSIQFHLDEACGKVSLDSRQIYHVLLNIFTNAEEAMLQGGELFISTGVNREMKQAWVSIRDTGKGIPQEHLEKVFDRFFTTKDSGLGLGLSLVKKVMESHAGSVRIESLPQHGTKVALYFPL